MVECRHGRVVAQAAAEAVRELDPEVQVHAPKQEMLGGDRIHGGPVDRGAEADVLDLPATADGHLLDIGVGIGRYALRCLVLCNLGGDVLGLLVGEDPLLDEGVYERLVVG